MLVLGGVAVTLALILPVLFIINHVVTPDGVDRIARLCPVDVLGTILLGIVTAISASARAVHAIGEIAPDEVLHAS